MDYLSYIMVILLITGANVAYRKLRFSKDGVKSYYCGNNGVSEITKDNEENIRRLIVLEKLKVFKEINNTIANLESANFKPNTKVAFLLGERAKEIIDYLEFLESKNIKIIASNFNIIKERDDIRLSDVISITLEDENGVIYFLFSSRQNEVSIGDSIYIQYKLDIPFVLKENSLSKLSDNTDASDLFLPREKYGKPLSDSISKTNMTEDIDNNKLILTFYWNKEHNIRLYFPLTEETIID